MASIDLPMERQTSTRPPSRALSRPAPRRSLPGQITAALFQPGSFFATLPAGSSRQWLLAALLILALAGFTAVRHAELKAKAGANDAAASPVDFGAAPPVEGDFGAPVEGGGAIPGGEFPSPGDFGGSFPLEDAGGASASTTSTWTTALVGAGELMLAWAIQALLLCEVSLFNGRLPKLGRNVQIAVWASLPLALMAALQLVYYWAGGTMGEPGLLGLIVEWEGFAAQPPFAQALLLSLASRLTIFWLWSLLLLYIGGRMALNGRSWAVALVLVAWAAVSVVAPVATGAIAAPGLEIDALPLGEMPLDPSLMPEGMPFDPALMPEGEMPIEVERMDAPPVEGEIIPQESAP